MKKLIALLLCVQVACCLKAQDKIYTYPLPESMSRPKKDRQVTHLAMNPRGKDFVLTSTMKDIAHHFLFDGSFQLISTFRQDTIPDIQTNDHYSEVAGVWFDQKKVTRFYLDYDWNKAFVTQLDFDNKKLTQESFFKSSREELIVSGISRNDTFYAITIVAETEALNIYRKAGNNKVEKRVINIPGIFQLNGAKLHNVIRYGLRVDKESLENPVVAANETKLYLINDSLVLTLDNYMQKTQVLSISTNSFRHSYHAYPQLYTDCKQRRQQAVSVIMDEYLFQTTACTDKIHFVMRNYNDGKILKEYITQKHEKPPHAVSEYIYTEAFYTDIKSGRRKMPETKYFIQLIREEGAVLLMPRKMDGYWLFRIGAHYNPVPETYYVFSLALLPAMIPIREEEYFNYPYRQYFLQGKARYYCLALEDGNFNFKDNLSISYTDFAQNQAGEFMEQLPQKIQRLTFFRKEGKVVGTYIDWKERTLNLAVFSDKPFD
jgi:hypothetical protein